MTHDPTSTTTPGRRAGAPTPPHTSGSSRLDRGIVWSLVVEEMHRDWAEWDRRRAAGGRRPDGTVVELPTPGGEGPLGGPDAARERAA